MLILGVDQARNGAWSVFDYDSKKLVDYGTFSFSGTKYTFEQATVEIEKLIEQIVRTQGIDAVFIEDVQMQKNPQVMKKLARLQGVLINLCEKNHFAYGVVTPSQWQSYCGARGRSAKEKKAKLTKAETGGRRVSKIFSMQYVKEKFGIETENDNLADAISISDYVVNNIELRKPE